MRIAVLPREVASGIITASLVRGAWAISAANLVLGVVLLVDYLGSHGLLAQLPVPLAVIVGMLALTGIAIWRDRAWTTAACLVAGAVGNVVYQVALLRIDPLVVDDGTVVLNRVAVSLVLVGVTGAPTVAAIAWMSTGFALAMASTLVASMLAGAPFIPGWGAAMFLGLAMLCFVTLDRVQAAQRRRIPDFASLEQEMRRLTEQERLRLRANAALHDTLLNDLTVVMNAPDVLDDHTAARLLGDLERLRRGDWRGDAPSVDGDRELRDRLRDVATELQWQGLTVHLSGDHVSAVRLDGPTASAIVGAVSAALENVLQHSGQAEAELDVSFANAEATVIVSDHGAGFDPDAVPPDRLGLRNSVSARIHDLGGTVRLWSSPGGGTSLVIRVPIETGART